MITRFCLYCLHRLLSYQQVHGTSAWEMICNKECPFFVHGYQWFKHWIRYVNVGCLHGQSISIWKVGEEVKSVHYFQNASKNKADHCVLFMPLMYQWCQCFGEMVISYDYFLGLWEFINRGLSAQSMETSDRVWVGGNAVVTMPSLSDGSRSVGSFAMKHFLNPSDSLYQRKMDCITWL